MHASTRSPSANERFQSRLAEAVDELGAILAEENYQNQSTVNLMAQLAPLSGNEIPLIEAIKRIGLQAASTGQIDTTIRYLEMMAARAGLVGQRRDPRSRTAMRYLYDAEVDAGYAAIAEQVPPPAFTLPDDGRLRVALVVSSITDDNSGSRVACAVAAGLAARGHSVRVIATGHVASSSSRASQRLQQSGIRFDEITGASHEGRLRALLANAATDPAHVAVYLTYPMDGVAKAAASVGAAPAQVFINTSYEQFCGRFDAILQTVSEDQITRSVNPAISRFVGTGLVGGAAIDVAVPVSRAALGAPENAILFGTFGRLQKCCEEGYLIATAAILQALPKAVLLLAGPAYDTEEGQLRAHYSAAGVADRVLFLGPRENEVPSLLKTLDIYLDTFPFPGAQSVLEAMRAGVPVVAMRTVPDKDLDPTGTGPTTAVAERFLGPDQQLAEPGDLSQYVRIAAAYAQDPEKRSRDGQRLAARARSEFDFEQFMDRVDCAITEAASASRR